MTSCNNKKCHFIDKGERQEVSRDMLRYSAQVRAALSKCVVIMELNFSTVMT